MRQAPCMLQRFQLMVYPDRPKPFENVDRYPDTEAKNKAFEIFEYLDKLEPLLLGAERDAYNPESIPALRFDPDAQALFDGWHAELMTRLQDPALEATPAFHAHLAKYPSLMPSLALLFHLVDVASGAASGPVSEDAADRAAAWCDFLELHARKIYAAELNSEARSVHALAERIVQGAVEDGMSTTEIYPKKWAHLKTAEEVTCASRDIRKRKRLDAT